MGKKLGRPPSDNPKDRVIQVRLTKAERAALDAKAHEAGQNASDYIRTVAITPKEA